MTVEHPVPYLILQGPDGKLDAFLTECLRLRGAAMPTPGNIATGRLRTLSHTSSHWILTLHSTHRTPSLTFETMLPATLRSLQLINWDVHSGWLVSRLHAVQWTPWQSPGAGGGCLSWLHDEDDSSPCRCNGEVQDDEMIVVHQPERRCRPEAPTQNASHHHSQRNRYPFLLLHTFQCAPCQSSGSRPVRAWHSRTPAQHSHLLPAWLGWHGCSSPRSSPLRRLRSAWPPFLSPRWSIRPARERLIRLRCPIGLARPCRVTERCTSRHIPQARRDVAARCEFF